VVNPDHVALEVLSGQLYDNSNLVHRSYHLSSFMGLRGDNEEKGEEEGEGEGEEDEGGEAEGAIGN
jgi:hypothetical protein